ncbi:unnamed protein product [Boreogadus saida]
MAGSSLFITGNPNLKRDAVVKHIESTRHSRCPDFYINRTQSQPNNPVLHCHTAPQLEREASVSTTSRREAILPKGDPAISGDHSPRFEDYNFRKPSGTTMDAEGPWGGGGWALDLLAPLTPPVAQCYGAGPPALRSAVPSIVHLNVVESYWHGVPQMPPAWNEAEVHTSLQGLKSSWPKSLAWDH